MFSNVLFANCTIEFMSKPNKVKTKNIVDFLGLPIVRLGNGTLYIKFVKPLTIR